MNTLPRVLHVAVTTTAAFRHLARLAVPALLIVALIVIVLAWRHTSYEHEFFLQGIQGGIGTIFIENGVELFFDRYRWVMGLPVLATLFAIDVLLLSRFRQGWRTRWWGRKPPEIERATRYFLG